MLWRRYPATPAVEVLPTTPAPPAAEIYVGGEVPSPGFYPWRPGLTVEEALQAAGGANTPAGPVKILVSSPTEETSPQKININTAPAWLLEALPGIGPSLSGAIITYREKYGPFRTIEDLDKVPRIGPALLEKVRELITVGE